ncbi:restriction endonuclease subunit S [Streptococcus suis]|uniref:restriction endonuclease subunit S n=1 Tax=Streptococcus suis TaxID=1307 RepID=UPI00240EE5CC|nr:restriction endonuclease subunit S [Streptococcus suis]MDG3136169.1 restriction endonuclease subunit S [Streptococcus suis]
MPNKERNIPKRRFKAFENADAWELRKLGEVGAVAMCRRIFKEQTSEIGEIPFYKIGTFGGTPDAFISKELFEEYRNKYPYPTKGDILISASGSIGRTVEFLGKDEYFQDSNIVWLKHDGKIDNIFLKQFYSIVKWSGVEGSTIKRLYNENILNTEIALPSLLEQKAIGTFFSTLDRQITLHQRKLDKLKHVKQAYLSEMFPAEGERVPKRRFPGFTDAWEQRRFSELAEIRRGLTYSPTSIRKEGIRVLRSSNIDEDTFTFGEDDVFVDKGVVKIPLVKEGDILITAANGSSRLVGKHTIIKGLPANSTVHGGFMLLASCRNPEFVNSLISSEWYNKFISLYVAGGNGAIGNLNKNDLDNQLVVVPSTSEQSAIGTFFSTLDQQITLHQRKLEKLKNLKKALLNELFI